MYFLSVDVPQREYIDRLCNVSTQVVYSCCVEAKQTKALVHVFFKVSTIDTAIDFKPSLTDSSWARSQSYSSWYNPFDTTASSRAAVVTRPSLNWRYRLVHVDFIGGKPPSPLCTRDSLRPNWPIRNSFSRICLPTLFNQMFFGKIC